MPRHNGNTFFNEATLQKVLISGGTVLFVIMLGKNVIGLQALPDSQTATAALTLAAASGLGCVLADRYVSPYVHSQMY